MGPSGGAALGPGSIGRAQPTYTCSLWGTTGPRDLRVRGPMSAPGPLWRLGADDENLLNCS